MEGDREYWDGLARALSFAGNALLAPPTQAGGLAVDPAFWRVFPDFGNAGVADAVGECLAWAQDAQGVREALEGADPVLAASAEFTRLFVGPPKPAAPPWETFYRGGTVGFGEATFQMRALLREAGLAQVGANNQYADHIGIEVLYAAALCDRVAAAEGAGRECERERLAAFVREHPLDWLSALQQAVAREAPDSFTARILALARALLSAL